MPEDVQYDTVETESDEYDLGERVVVQEGQLGLQEVVQDVTYINGVVTETNIVEILTVQAPVAEQVIVGTHVEESQVAQVGDGTWYWPVPDYRYVSRWDENGRAACDIIALYGSTIVAADSGTVVEAGTHWSYGNYVRIDHGNGWTTLYAHMSAIAVVQGQSVTAGQAIGYVGQTGVATATTAISRWPTTARWSAPAPTSPISAAPRKPVTLKRRIGVLRSSIDETSKQKNKPPRSRFSQWRDERAVKRTVRRWHKSERQGRPARAVRRLLQRVPHAGVIATCCICSASGLEYGAVCAGRTTVRAATAILSHVWALLFAIFRPLAAGLIIFLEDLLQPFVRLYSGVRHIRELPEQYRRKAGRRSAPRNSATSSGGPSGICRWCGTSLLICCPQGRWSSGAGDPGAAEPDLPAGSAGQRRDGGLCGERAGV